jgi:hypothetical protein
MKKIIVILLAVVCYGGNYPAHAQTSDKAYLLNTHIIGSDKAAVKANRDFWKRVGDMKNEEWFKLPKGYLATFTENGIQNRFAYDQKGNWLYALLTCKEKDMPMEVRKLVKSIYYDHTIGWVKEVRQGEVLLYVIHLENEKEWKEIVVQDGEITILHAYCKQ